MYITALSHFGGSGMIYSAIVIFFLPMAIVGRTQFLHKKSLPAHIIKSLLWLFQRGISQDGLAVDGGAEWAWTTLEFLFVVLSPILSGNWCFDEERRA